MADQPEYSDNSSALTSIEEDSVYQPKSAKTRAAYKSLLSVVEQQLDGQPWSKISDAADEILGIIKNDTVKNSDKKKDIELILSPNFPNHVFDEIVSIGNLITDFDTACNSGPYSRELRILGEQEDVLHDDMMVGARDLGIESEMENLPPLPPPPASLLSSLIRIHSERIGIMRRNLTKFQN